MPTPSTFADHLPIEQTSSHAYAFTFSDDWCTGTTPSGGYVASALLIAARTHMQRTHFKYGQNDVISCHVEYVHRTTVGPVTIRVQDIKLGSRTSNLHLLLMQPSDPATPQSQLQTKIHASVIMSSMINENGVTHQTEYKLSPPQLPVDQVALSRNTDLHYVLRRPDAFAEYRRAAGNVRMYFVRPEVRSKKHPPSIVDLWAVLTPRGHTLPGYWSNDALGFIVDIFTGINERYVNAEVEDALLSEDTTDEDLARLMKSSKVGGTAKFWYPTLVLNLDVKKKLPEPPNDEIGRAVMLFVRVQAKKILNGRMDLSVEVWDETGDLVALSSHVNLIMDAARNMTRTEPEVSSKM